MPGTVTSPKKYFHENDKSKELTVGDIPIPVSLLSVTLFLILFAIYFIYNIDCNILSSSNQE